jgi:hypothetical protein
MDTQANRHCDPSCRQLTRMLLDATTLAITMVGFFSSCTWSPLPPFLCYFSPLPKEDLRVSTAYFKLTEAGLNNFMGGKPSPQRPACCNNLPPLSVRPKAPTLFPPDLCPLCRIKFEIDLEDLTQRACLLRGNVLYSTRPHARYKTAPHFSARLKTPICFAPKTCLLFLRFDDCSISPSNLLSQSQ